ncbi:hypothetical protein SAMN05444366_1373 [Flavobacterium saccharophilum]|uniref:Uncharacterized protein n=1 Tax=Flavobacterium saccharophilum TaxID=29534 RepID=A0A1M7D245_9FLAO|nr:hypothetical protein SAMN05444366_1373 [Flavobacterium saccharophilum]
MKVHKSTLQLSEKTTASVDVSINFVLNSESNLVTHYLIFYFVAIIF